MMHISPQILTTIVSVSFVCFLGSAPVLGNGADFNDLEFEYRAGVFTFKLENKPFDENKLWVLQSSPDMSVWRDIDIFDRVRIINVPIQRGVRQQYYRVRKVEKEDPYLSDYIAAFAVWEKSGFDSYKMEIRHWSSWFFWHGNVIVRNNEVISTEAIDTNFPDTFNPEPRTMDDWFGVLKRNIDDKAYRIDVTYDENFGYPKSVFIDFELWLADEEQGWSILKFLPMR
ncbi:MAG: DUF6174 domain-containing protein [Verrucomicrobiota bacterium]|nr:DUF6174 domain-containing protein [Verrucomicrobiota bacterium]MEE2967942.1 DUF6174 domain-containing protein [Verrucomicrobiota bacterium]